MREATTLFDDAALINLAVLTDTRYLSAKHPYSTMICSRRLSAITDISLTFYFFYYMWIPGRLLKFHLNIFWLP